LGSLPGEEVVEGDQSETFRKRRLVTPILRQVHGCMSVHARAAGVADRLRRGRELDLDLRLQGRILRRLRKGLLGE
jgi:hypothetical protein